VLHVDLDDEDRARRALAAELLRVDAARGVGWLDGTSPFPGLVPFEAELRHAFFGRSREVQRLLQVLRSPAARAERQVLRVVGPSGCGKSSLVRAGLVPAVAEERGWVAVAPFVPGTDPVGALATALATAAEPLGLKWADADVRHRLGATGLGAVAGELLAATAPRARRLLLVVDQFEELLTPGAVIERRAEFVGLLAAALDGPVQVVATVRTEFLDQFLSLPEVAALPTRPEPVRPLQREAPRGGRGALPARGHPGRARPGDRARR
jgi:hypothetical protein